MERDDFLCSLGGRQPWDQPYHIILAGSADVGKTSVFKFLSGQTCNSEFALDTGQEPVILQPTLARQRSALKQGRWCHSVRLSSTDNVEVILWDTCNMERGSSQVNQITRSYFRQAVGVVLMYDACRRDTLFDLVKWVKSCRINSAWDAGKHVTFVLWSNERNFGNREVSPDDVKLFKQGCALDVAHFCVCTESEENINKYYCQLVASVHDRLTSSRPRVESGKIRSHEQTLSLGTNISSDNSPNNSQDACC